MFYDINYFVSESKPPLQIPLSELGIPTAHEDALRLKVWTVISNTVSLDVHNHMTSIDDRPYSIMRKTGPLLNPGPDDVPAHPLVMEAARRIYHGLLAPAAEYFGEALYPMPNRYAVTGHLHVPGDGAGESHLDYYPSVNVYLSGHEGEGDLLIAKTPGKKTMAEIRQDAYRISPIDESAIFFDGTQHSHYVEELPNSLHFSRVSMNCTYWRYREPDNPLHRRHVDAAEVMAYASRT